MHHERLVVADQRVGLPLPINQRLLRGQTFLEVGNALDLAGDEHRAVEEEGCSAPLG
jgi:hypothetical protein